MHKTECTKKPLPANGAASVIDTKDQYGYSVKVCDPAFLTGQAARELKQRTSAGIQTLTSLSLSTFLLRQLQSVGRDHLKNLRKATAP